MEICIFCPLNIFLKIFSYSLISNIGIKNAAYEGSSTHDGVSIPNYYLLTENVLNFLSLF